MKSLKACIPEISDILGATPSVLYERQRMLVRDELLDSLPGRGPGSGVRATPEAGALLLLGFFSTNLSDAGSQTRALARAAATGGKCPLTGAKAFGAALAAILSDQGVLSRVQEVLIRVSRCQGYIHYDPTSGAPPATTEVKRSIFVGRGSKPGGFDLTASIPSETLLAIAKVITE